MVSRKTILSVIGVASLLAACSQKTDNQAAAEADTANATASNAGMLEDLTNVSNDSNTMAPAAPTGKVTARGKRGNFDTRGTASSATTTPH